MRKYFRKGLLVLSLLWITSSSDGQVKEPVPRFPFEQSTMPFSDLQNDFQSLSHMTALERMRTFEKNASAYTHIMDELGIRQHDTDTLKVSLHAIDMSRSANDFLEDAGDKLGSKIRIPSMKVNDDLARMSYSYQRIFVLLAWWKNVADLPQPKFETIPTNSSALTISYFATNASDGTLVKYSLPVEYYIDLRKDFTSIDSLQEYESLRGVERQCAWLDLDTNTWQTSGCTTANVTGRGVYCKCNHTTTFVTLLLANTHEEIPYVVYQITLVMQIISIICLLLTIAFISVARHGTGIDSSSFAFEATGMNTNRTNSQISLCLSLLLMHIFSVLGGWVRSQSDNGCVATALLTQYFLLASAHWSLCEGLGIFAKLSSYLTMKIEYKSMTWIQIFIGWCLPLIITIITAAYGIKSDRLMDKSCSANGEVLDACVGLQFDEYKTCWLGRDSGMVWAAIGPLLAIILLNIAIFVYVTLKVVKIKRNQPKIDCERSNTPSNYAASTADGTLPRNNGRQSTLELPSNTLNTGRRSTLEHSIATKRRFSYILSITRSFGILMPILGIPWLFGILANINGASIALSSVHAVVNGLQGFLLFVLYCVSGKRDLKIVKRKCRNSCFTRIKTRRKYTVRRESASANATRNISPQQEQTNNNGSHQNQMNRLSIAQYDTLSSCRSSNGTVCSQGQNKNNKTKFHWLSCLKRTEK